MGFLGVVDAKSAMRTKEALRVFYLMFDLDSGTPPLDYSNVILL